MGTRSRNNIKLTRSATGIQVDNQTIDFNDFDVEEIQESLRKLNRTISQAEEEKNEILAALERDAVDKEIGDDVRKDLDQEYAELLTYQTLLNELLDGGILKQLLPEPEVNALNSIKIKGGTTFKEPLVGGMDEEEQLHEQLQDFLNIADLLEKNLGNLDLSDEKRNEIKNKLNVLNKLIEKPVQKSNGSKTAQSVSNTIKISAFDVKENLFTSRTLTEKMLNELRSVPRPTIVNSVKNFVANNNFEKLEHYQLPHGLSSTSAGVEKTYRYLDEDGNTRGVHLIFIEDKFSPSLTKYNLLLSTNSGGENFYSGYESLNLAFDDSQHAKNIFIRKGAGDNEKGTMWLSSRQRIMMQKLMEQIVSTDGTLVLDEK